MEENLVVRDITTIFKDFASGEINSSDELVHIKIEADDGSVINFTTTKDMKQKKWFDEAVDSLFCVATVISSTDNLDVGEEAVISISDGRIYIIGKTTMKVFYKVNDECGDDLIDKIEEYCNVYVAA